jgi:hypothetical protein
MARKGVVLTGAAVTEDAARLANLARLKAHVRENSPAGRSPFEGLASHEIGEYNRAIMLGDNNEAWPGDAAWSRIVD